MEIILKEDIIGLGYKNDIVNVKSGYGRNYLIPTEKAVIASESTKQVLAENLAALKAEAVMKADALYYVVLVIAAQVSATGVTYGSVNTNIVAEELKKQGFDIDRKIITMRDIKSVGDYEAVVHFHKEVEVKVPVKVVAEDAPVENKEEEAAPVAETAEKTEDNAEKAE